MLKIVDNQVFNDVNENVALRKNDFADLVSTNARGFDDFSFDEFAKIYDIISSKVEETNSTTSLIFSA